MNGPELKPRERLVLAAYYTGQISGGKAAELLGLPHKVAMLDWLKLRGLVYLLSFSSEIAAGTSACR